MSEQISKSTHWLVYVPYLLLCLINVGCVICGISLTCVLCCYMLDQPPAGSPDVMPYILMVMLLFMIGLVSLFACFRYMPKSGESQYAPTPAKGENNDNCPQNREKRVGQK